MSPIDYGCLVRGELGDDFLYSSLSSQLPSEGVDDMGGERSVYSTSPAITIVLYYSSISIRYLMIT